MAKCYQYTADGYYAGEVDDYGGPVPNNATRTAPRVIAEHIPRWNGTGWEQVENHRGAEGYLDGKPHTIKEYGPLPDGWSDTPPEPAPEERNAQRRAEIEAELAALDAKSARAMRALLTGTATEEDQARLAELEREAANLRRERAVLTASPQDADQG